MIRQSNLGRLLGWLAERRMLFTLLTALTLTAAYSAYARITRPILQRSHFVAEVRPEEMLPKPPPVSIEVSQKHLPAQTWIQNADHQFRRGQTFVFFHNRKLVNDDHALEVQPFALIMMRFDPQGKELEPITVVCEKARLNFDRKLEISANFKGSDITGGALLGRVQIKAENNVTVQGHNFNFSQTLRVWSDNDVQFQVQNHWGEAHGVDIKLLNDPKRPNDGLFSTAGVDNVRLRNDVKLHLEVDSSDERDSDNLARTGQPDRPETVQVRCDGSFEFDFDTKIAEFQRNVRVHHETQKRLLDTLNCDQLRIKFEERERRGANAMVADRERDREDRDFGLEPTLLTAAGQNCLLESEDNHLRVHMASLVYDLDERHLVLSAVGAASVRVYQDDPGPTPEESTSRTLVGHRVKLTHNEDGRITDAVCTGPNGLFQQRNGADEVEFSARWTNQLTLRTDPQTGLDLLTITGNALFRQDSGDDDERFQIRAERLFVEHENTPQEETTRSAKAQTNERERRSEFRVRQIRAEQDVVVQHSRISGPTQNLIIEFPEEDPPETQPSPLPKTAADATSPSDSKRNVRDDDPAPLKFAADKIRVRMQHKPQDDGFEPGEIWMDGHVDIRQPNAAEPAKSVRLAGDSVHVIQRAKSDRYFEMFGLPASVKADGRKIEGEHLTFEENANRATVKGPGLIEWMVEQDLQNEKLAAPQPLTITWLRGMVFDGRVATLTGSVTARMQDGERRTEKLECKRMHITFVDSISFDQFQDAADANRPDGEQTPSSEPATEDEPPPVETIYCEGLVTLTSSESKNGIPVAHRRAEIRDVQLDVASGVLIGSGPGWMESWRPDRGRRPALAPKAAVRANQPLMAANVGEWEYLRIDFLGAVSADTERRSTKFKDDVEVVYGPVSQFGNTIDPDRLDVMPKDSGKIDCNELLLTHHDSENPAERHMNLLGIGNVILEGSGFHAQAHQVSFDGSKELFILKAENGGAPAEVYQQESPGVPAVPTKAQTISFNPAQGEVRVGNVQTIQGQPQFN